MGFYQAVRAIGGVIGALMAGMLYGLDPKVPFIFACAGFAILGGLRIPVLHRHPQGGRGPLIFFGSEQIKKSVSTLPDAHAFFT